MLILVLRQLTIAFRSLLSFRQEVCSFNICQGIMLCLLNSTSLIKLMNINKTILTRGQEEVGLFTTEYSGSDTTSMSIMVLYRHLLIKVHINHQLYITVIVADT